MVINQTPLTEYYTPTTVSEWIVDHTTPLRRMNGGACYVFVLPIQSSQRIPLRERERGGWRATCKHHFNKLSEGQTHQQMQVHARHSKDIIQDRSSPAEDLFAKK